MDKKQLITEVNDLLETYCEGCFLREHNRKTNSKYYAHSFCIRQCTVGETLKSMENSCHEKTSRENSLDVFSVLLRLVDAHIYLISFPHSLKWLI